jgi:D-galactarolactone cycloisomerase
MISICRVEAYLYRVALTTPVVLSFGRMNARWALLVSIEDEHGTKGWGEIWCNFPDCGALHRYRLLHQIFRPVLEGVAFDDPEDIYALLNAKTRILKIQTAETGPIDQCIAGLDCAVWDLAARHHKIPLYQLLGGSSKIVKTYASGINPKDVAITIRQAHDQGHRRFKVKVGFGEKTDLETLSLARESARDMELACDANQAWELTQAIHHADLFEPFGLSWIEEPIAADRPVEEWKSIAEHTNIRIAAGENLNTTAGFLRMMTASGLGIIQPDLAKWGGISGCREIAKTAAAYGLPYYPHYLGAAVGLITSAHLLASANPDGLLEVDVNNNPLRSNLLEDEFMLADGALTLKDAPGLGFTPALEKIQQYRITPQID